MLNFKSLLTQILTKYLPKTGGTMTGELKITNNNSVAIGSYGSAQTTVDGLVQEVRYSSGCMGSVSINTQYAGSSATVSTGWYNFIWIPHRSGGVNGAASGDNCNYGNLLLMGMAMDLSSNNSIIVIRVSGGTIAETYAIKKDNVYKNNMTSNTTTYYQLYGTAGTNYFYSVRGGVVQATFTVKCNSAGEWPGSYFCSGLPKPYGGLEIYGGLIDYSGNSDRPGRGMAISIHGDGTVYGAGGVTGGYYYGTITYITKDILSS